ncbi:hypothetical protein DRF62_18565 [Chryseobacterium piscium]|uniref:HTH cro/C1-type domain-containing protein n=1 Tax=Chryseobacterium piscium TaxID=333702 RepID=A0A3D9BBM0_9FLAO|nr:helix-turn-helix domain-containing protein [Chryseobacterium piscium]REC50798.1 hypothetical protein DRF62_18565 [Chryseobacterium piscium]
MFEKFNEIFLKIRLKEGLTQEQFAEKLSVSRSTIAKIESKRQDVTKKIVEKLSTTFPDSYNFIQKETESNNLEQSHNIVSSEWKTESVLKKDHYVIKIVETYRKDIDTIEYFNNKINLSIAILQNLGSEPDNNFTKLKEVLEKNLADLKEIYGYFLIGSLTREELIVNKDFFKNKQSEKLNNILSSESSIQWEKTSDELMTHSKNLLELFKNCFDDIFELINKYSQIK